jgi:hypothetical protein
MNDNIHLDREAIMDGASIDFPAAYDAAITKIINRQENASDYLKEKLKAKRDFGFKKYGERSFQGSFLNAMTSPSFEDLEEELIDAINYLLHIQFQLFFKEPLPTSFPERALLQLIELHKELKNVQRDVLGND